MICRQTTQVYGGDSGLFRVYEVSPLGKTLVYLSWPCAMTSKHALSESRDYTARICWKLRGEASECRYASMIIVLLDPISSCK